MLGNVNFVEVVMSLVSLATFGLVWRLGMKVGAVLATVQQNTKDIDDLKAETSGLSTRVGRVEGQVSVLKRS